MATTTSKTMPQATIGNTVADDADGRPDHRTKNADEIADPTVRTREVKSRFCCGRVRTRLVSFAYIFPPLFLIVRTVSFCIYRGWIEELIIQPLYLHSLSLLVD